MIDAHELWKMHGPALVGRQVRMLPLFDGDRTGGVHIITRVAGEKMEGSSIFYIPLPTDVGIHALRTVELLPPEQPDTPFQFRVRPWLVECFGEEKATSKTERMNRFVEEAIELAQACGATRDTVRKLVDYVYGRPPGEASQEVGGVMLTLAALCLAENIEMDAAGETELARVWTKIDAIRAKNANAPHNSPLPGSYLDYSDELRRLEHQQWFCKP